MPQTRLEVQQTQRLSQNMQTAIKLLSMDLDDLSAYMQKAIGENPALEYLPPKKSAQDAVLFKSRWRSGAGEYKGADTAAAVNAIDNLEQQLRLANLSEPVCRAAVLMLHGLSPRGYMTQDLGQFAREAGVSLDTAQAALEAVQALEPAGIGARSVSECLALQLRERPDVDALCHVLVRDHLEEIAKGDLRRAARATGASVNRVLRCVDVIRSLTPSPCSLSSGAVVYITPEFSVETEENGQITILFHNDYYPSIRQDEGFVRLAGTLSGGELSFVRGMLTSAAQLIRALEMRRSTMEKLAQILTREQRAFFLGQYSLLPLSVSDVAAELGVHEATVYRAIQGKYLYCSRGMFPLSHFFQRDAGEGVSTARVKEIIESICRERGKVPDREIAEALGQRGIKISRRTVAKYRAQMNIDSSFRRQAEEKE